MNETVSESPGLVLVRHGAIDPRYRGICYGSSDVPLGPEGYRQHAELLDRLSALPLRCVMHSGLKRTRLLAEAIGWRHPHRQLLCCPELRERDFGEWELQSWDDIHAAHGEAMMGMIHEPASYRPGGGETTLELRDRVMRWYEALPDDGLTIAVTHGGPIAALLGTLQGRPITDWPQLIPACGKLVRTALAARRQPFGVDFLFP